MGARKTGALQPEGSATTQAQKGQKGGEQVRQAQVRQLKAVKQVRTMIPASLQRIRPIGKLSIARAIQPRQLSSIKSVQTPSIEGFARPQIGKISSARVAQVRQRFAAKFKGQLKSG
jgi:hypothetical protein